MQFLTILGARWRLVLSVIVLVIGGTAAASLLWPRQYAASASLLVDFKPDPVSAVALGGLGTSAVMATQADIVRSERVALRAVRALNLPEDDPVRQQWLAAGQGQGPFELWLARRLHKQLDVQPARESSVLTITYKAGDPQLAAALANAWAQAALATNAELRTEPARRFAGYFDNRSGEARDRLERAQSRLGEFQRANGIVSGDERIDVETARLNELSSQLTTLQAVAAESGSRNRVALRGEGDQLHEVINHPLIGQLKAELTRAEARLQELGTRLGDNHPQVQEARASAAQTRARLETETQRVAGGAGVAHGIDRAREGTLRAALDAQRAKVLKMKALRDEGAVIARDVEIAQRAYDAVAQRASQNGLESQATQAGVSLLSLATPPSEPASPRLLFNLVLAIAAALPLGAAAALLREAGDRRVRGRADLQALEAECGLPLLAVLPAAPGGARRLGFVARWARPALPAFAFARRS